MSGNLESNIIRHCAPTLAGIKTANMFSCRFQDTDTLQKELQEENQKLNEKGVFIEVLKTNENKALIYVYRRNMLGVDLARKEAVDILKKCGYEETGWEASLNLLKERLVLYGRSCTNGCVHEAGAKEDGDCPLFCFPHEIGLFLGYPIEDVRGFMEQNGQNYKCRGIWKVYGDENETQKLFRKLEKCAQVYQRLFAGGRSIRKLTVAA